MIPRRSSRNYVTAKRGEGVRGSRYAWHEKCGCYVTHGVGGVRPRRYVRLFFLKSVLSSPSSAHARHMHKQDAHVQIATCTQQGCTRTQACSMCRCVRAAWTVHAHTQVRMNKCMHVTGLWNTCVAHLHAVCVCT